MALTVYKSTDASAPVLSGTAGTLIALLDACLVNGYTGKTALGWVKAFSATNSAVYRAPSGLRHYLQITDTGALGRGAGDSGAFGFETMTAFGVGSGQYPTPGQLVNGLCWCKSQANDATARSWMLVGDDRTFYLAMNAQNTAPYIHAFGEFESYKAGDSFNSVIVGSSSFNNNTATMGAVAPQAYGAAGASNGIFIARSYTQLGSSLGAYFVGPMANAAGLGASGIAYPNGPDGGLYQGPVFVCEPGAGTPIRGRMRGYYAPLHAMPLVMYDTASNIQGLTGVTCMAVTCTSSGTGPNAQVLFDITGPW
jgi:hypothetical protein